MEKNVSKKLFENVVDMFPHLSIKNYGFGIHMPASPQIPLGIYGFDNDVPNDGMSDLDFFELKNGHIQSVLARAQRVPSAVRSDYIQYHIILEWLKAINDNIDWDEVLGYLSAIDQKTYENGKTQYNFIVTTRSGGSTLDPTKSFKLTDQLGSSLFTYFRVSSEFKLISMEEVSWDRVKDRSDAPFYPSFMHPLMSTLDIGEVLVSRTQRGDIVICDKSGIIATKRRGSWKIFYKNAVLKRVLSIVSVYSSTITTQFVNEIVSSLLDLSFKRHGALIVFDNNFKIDSKIKNRVSVLSSDTCKGIRRIIGDSINKKDKNSHSAFDSPRIFSEIASIDGAVILDEKGIYAYNSFIQSECITNDMGARSTAASAAYELGALPFKVSSDGDTEIIYRNPETGEKCVMCLA